MEEYVERLAAIAHTDRLAVLRLLTRRYPGSIRAGEIAQILNLADSTLSAHLATLSRAGLVRASRRGRSILYAADATRVGALLDFLIHDCCRSRPDFIGRAPHHPSHLLDGTLTMPDRKFDVLFICSGNSARSIFGEALLRDLGGSRFRAFSAGTRPFSELNPMAVEMLRDKGHGIGDLRAKTVAEFQRPEAPMMDFVFTVCDRAADEECPPWPGQPITAHWGMVDPVKATGTDAERALAFQTAYGTLRRRIEAFVNLPVAELDRMTLQRRVDEIGGQLPALDAAN
ncbi:MAG: metalloregulator ArsR/SmtB family transcription factor [Pseudomonadota bacterium]